MSHVPYLLTHLINSKYIVNANYCSHIYIYEMITTPRNIRTVNSSHTYIYEIMITAPRNIRTSSLYVPLLISTLTL